MGKIVGKLFVAFLSFYALYIETGIRLEMRTADGVAHDSAVVGQPFLIEAIIDGVQGSVQAPQIEGLDRFFAKRTGMYMSSINGASTTKYTYQVRIDQPGNYIIGPAHLMYQQQELVSNTVVVTVGNDVSPASKTSLKNNKKTDLKVFLRLMVDVDRVVVGQKINTTLRFYYQDPAMSLVNIGQGEVTGFDVKPVEKPVGGTVDVNGVHYKYAEWQWEMYPTKAGEFVIPAYSADYEIPVKDNHLLGGFFMFMNTRADRKRVYSNAAKITVDPLPHNQLPVKAVGTFESIMAHITPPVAKEGEGMVLTLEISGNGNMHAIEAPLLNMPSALKYYDSNVTLIDAPNSDACAKKRFEFIVQGMKSGDWEIPEQSFVYYDIDKHAYVTLKSSPMSITIQPSLYKPSVHSSHTNDEVSKKEIIIEEPCIAPINMKGPWYPITEHTPLPWILFYCIMCAPMVYVGYPVMGRWLLRFDTIKRRNKKKACRTARKKIMICMSTNDDKLVYSIFMELFAFLKNQPSSTLSRDDIERYLKEVGFSDYDSKEWHMFFTASAHAAYAQSDSSKVHELCRMAIQWLERFEKIV